MTDDTPQQEDPLVTFKRLKAEQSLAADDPIARFRALKAASPETPPQSPAHDPTQVHADFKSGALQRRNAVANASDPDAGGNDIPEPGYGERVATHVLNTAQGIPGVEAIEAAAATGPRANKTGVVAPGMSYKESLDALRANTGRIGGVTSAIEKGVGSLAMLPFVPAKLMAGGKLAGAGVGALTAGAARAGRADPESKMSRFTGTLDDAAIGAGVGAAIPWAAASPTLRMLTGAGVGGYEGYKHAPEGAKLEVGLAGATAGGFAARNLPEAMGVLGDAAKKISLSRPASYLQSLATATGTKGVVNQDMGRIDRVLKTLNEGAMVGEQNPLPGAMLAQQANTKAMSGVNYPRALDEATTAVDHWKTVVRNAKDENVRRAAQRLQVEAEEAARATDQSTTQSRAVVPNQLPTIREALDNFAAAKGEVARRSPPGGTPTSEPLPRAQDVVANDRFGQFRRPVEGERATELSHTTTPEPPGSGNPLEAAGDVQQTRVARGPLPLPTGELPTASEAQAVRHTPAATKEPLPPPGEPVLGRETQPQRLARETLEKRSAYQALPKTQPEIPLPAKLPDVGVPSDIHPAVAPIYGNPRIQQVASALGKLHEFNGLAPDDPRVIDGLYKVFSDQKGALAQRIENATGEGGVNLGRFTAGDIQHAQGQILDAMDALGSSYRGATTAHAQAMAGQESTRRGADAVTSAGKSTKAILKKSPAATTEWAQQQPSPVSPAEGARLGFRGIVANQGLRGGSRGVVDALGDPLDAMGKRALTESPQFESVLSRVRREIPDPNAKGPSAWHPIAYFHHLRAGLPLQSEARKIQEALASNQGKSLMESIAENPQAYQGTLRSAESGRRNVSALQAIAAALGGSAVGR